MKAVLLALLTASLALAGCGSPDDGGGGGGGGGGTSGPLPADKGAISGLLIDDVYRPVPNGLLLLQPAGLTATSDEQGVFSFDDLDPGAYVLQVSAEGHEAAPRQVEVVAGEYAEVELEARRIFNEGGRIITTEYSIFMTCTAELVVVAGNGINCFQDLSGESERTAFLTNLSKTAGVTYMVTEARFNQVGDYSFVIATDTDGDNFLDDYWAEAEVVKGNYVRVVNKANETNTEAGLRNQQWEPSGPAFTTTIFPHGEFYQEVNENTKGTVCTDGCWGLGVDAGVRAKIIQSVFIGEPEVDITSYCVLC